MSIAELPATCSARLSADGTKIILGPGPAAWTEFCHSLPNARWNGIACRWTCDYTPAAAWRIGCRGEMVRFDRSEDFRLDAQLHEAARRFSRQIQSSQATLQDCNLKQPVSKTTTWKHQLTAFHFANAICGGIT
jgi:hypothetical protein